MPGEVPLPTQEYPDDSQVTVCCALTAFGDDALLLAAPGRDIVIDEITMYWNSGTPANTVTIKRSADGVAASSGTAITTALAMTGLAANTVHSFTLVNTQNVVPAGQKLGFDASGALGVSGMVVQIRWRSKRR